MFALQINKSKLVNLLYKSKLVTFSQAKTPSKSFPQTIKLIFQSGLLESLQWSIQEKKDTFHFSSEEDESQKLFKRSRLVPPSTCTSNTQINTSFREKIQTLQNDNSREVLQMAQILQGHFALTVQRIQRALQAKKARSSSNTSKNMHSLKKNTPTLASNLTSTDSSFRSSNGHPATPCADRWFQSHCPESFFHECGRRVGGVPRSSLKGKETQHDEGEKNTSNPTQAKTPQTENKNQKPKSHHSPSSKRVSSVPG